MVAVAILLSSSLIFFGMVYNANLQAELQIREAQQREIEHITEEVETALNVTSYEVRQNGSAYQVTMNLTNTGSVTVALGESTLLVNGTVVNFTFSAPYLFPQGRGHITFDAPSVPFTYELVAQDGYSIYGEVE